VVPPDKVTLTVVMEARDVSGDVAPRRNRDHYRLTGFVSDDKRCVLGAVLRNSRRLGHRQLPPIEVQTRQNARQGTSSWSRLLRYIDGSLAFGMDTRDHIKTLTL